MIRRILVGLCIVVLVLVAGGAIFVAARQRLVFDAPYPAIAASGDSAIVARGRYLVRDLAPCAECHASPDERDAALAGEEVPLSGGYVFDLPLGRFHVPNLTPDAETGIGRRSDGDIARALRHGVGHDGRALLPFMEVHGLADDDLAAIVSYLRAQPAVRRPVPAHEYTLLGRVLRATALANPVGARETPPAARPRGPTIESGRYIVESVAMCGGCHTARDPFTGAVKGPVLGGSTGLPDHGDAGHTWSPPNITSDPETGRLAQLSEDAFVTRMRAGRTIPGSPMPWASYQRMADDDLRAIHRYLRSVPPARNDVGPARVETRPARGR